MPKCGNGASWINIRSCWRRLWRCCDRWSEKTKAWWKPDRNESQNDALLRWKHNFPKKDSNLDVQIWHFFKGTNCYLAVAKHMFVSETVFLWARFSVRRVVYAPMKMVIWEMASYSFTDINFMWTTFNVSRFIGYHRGWYHRIICNVWKPIVGKPIDQLVQWNGTTRDIGLSEHVLFFFPKPMATESDIWGNLRWICNTPF